MPCNIVGIFAIGNGHEISILCSLSLKIKPIPVGSDIYFLLTEQDIIETKGLVDFKIYFQVKRSSHHIVTVQYLLLG